MSLEKKVTKIRNLFPKSSPIHFRFETGQTSFLNCNLCWMGGHLSIHAVDYPSNIFYELKTGQSDMYMITLFIWIFHLLNIKIIKQIIKINKSFSFIFNISSYRNPSFDVFAFIHLKLSSSETFQ